MEGKQKICSTSPELDWVTVTGSTTKISIDNEIHVARLRNYFCGRHGFKKEQTGRSLIFKSPPNFRTIYIHFQREKGGKKGTRIMAEFPGGYMYGGESQDRINEIKNFALTVFEDLRIENGPHFSQMDIQIDRLGATFASHGYSLNSKKYALVSTRRKTLSYTAQAFFNNPDDPSEQTGQRIRANKVDNRTYDRKFALEQKYNTPEYRHYKEYYEKLYQGYDRILREEVKFKKGLLEPINGSFWGLNRPIKQIMEEALSKYNSLYKIIDLETGKPVKEREDFYDFGKFKSRKEMFKQLGIKPPSGEARYNDIIRDPKTLLKHLAEAYLTTDKLESKDFIALALKIRSDIPKAIDREVFNLTDRMKTKLLITPKEKHLEIKEDYGKRIDEVLELKKKFPDNPGIVKRELKEALDELTNTEDFLK